MDLGRIYIIKNEVNNKVYIGKTIQKLENRWHDHHFNVCKSSIKRFVKLHKDIISPRVSDTLASKVEGKNVL